MNDPISNNSSLPISTNILWAGTYYDHVEYDQKNKNSDIIWESEANKLPYFDVFVRFQFQQLTSKQIRLTCVRTIGVSTWTNVQSDYGYALQFHCSISIDDNDPSVFYMQGKENIAYVTLHLKYDYNYNPFDSKILVKVIENNNILESRERFCQEIFFKGMEEHFFNSESVLKYLCHILNRTSIENIFTGRQDFEFATLKTIYVKRTAVFAKDIADYLRRKEAYVYMPILDWSYVLNYILYGEECPISNNDLINGYHQAYLLGLIFLADLARDTIIVRLGDPNFVIESLQAADSVNDEVLLGQAAQACHSWGEAILNSQKWFKMLEDSSVKCRFITYSINRLAKRESQSSLQFERPSTSNFL